MCAIRPLYVYDHKDKGNINTPHIIIGTIFNNPKKKRSLKSKYFTDLSLVTYHGPFCWFHFFLPWAFQHCFCLSQAFQHGFQHDSLLYRSESVLGSHFTCFTAMRYTTRCKDRKEDFR